MKKVYAVISVVLMLLSGCTEHKLMTGTETAMPGSDRDAQGCIGSAGYSWCAKTNKCERPWELAKQTGFENTDSGFDKYCGQ